MVPRGNMIHCLLKEVEGGKNLVQAKFKISEKEVPSDIMEVENEMIEFLQSGITDIDREGLNYSYSDNLTISPLSRRVSEDGGRGQGGIIHT